MIRAARRRPVHRAGLRRSRACAPAWLGLYSVGLPLAAMLVLAIASLCSHGFAAWLATPPASACVLAAYGGIMALPVLRLRPSLVTPIAVAMGAALLIPSLSIPNQPRASRSPAVAVALRIASVRAMPVRSAPLKPSRQEHLDASLAAP